MTVDGKLSAALEASLSETIDRVVTTIVRACKPEQIMLFGSAATGAWRPDSDLDLLVIAHSELPRHRRSAALRLLFDPYPCPMDILVYTPEEVSQWRDVTNHVVSEALRTGQVVYERT